MIESRLELEGGKYTLVLHANGKFEALRYGKKWRDLIGDKLVLVLMQEVQRLGSQLDQIGILIRALKNIDARRRKRKHVPFDAA